MTDLSVALLGAGRMGQGIALALVRAGARVALVARREHAVTPPLVLHRAGRADAIRRSAIVCLAVPDGGIASLATELAEEGAIGPASVVLHLSGLLDRRALAPLASTGAALGSFHPLQAVADPAAGPERLAGAYAGIEGDERALEAGERLAAALRMHTVRLGAAGKAVYHAGAVMAANYTVALAAVAERLAVAAGVPAEAAARIYLPLVRGAAANLELGPVVALTGPIRRGDAHTVAAHLAALEEPDRVLYRRLGLEALRLARSGGLDSALADEVETVLRQGD